MALLIGSTRLLKYGVRLPRVLTVVLILLILLECMKQFLRAVKILLDRHYCVLEVVLQEWTKGGVPVVFNGVRGPTVASIG